MEEGTIDHLQLLHLLHAVRALHPEYVRLTARRLRPEFSERHAANTAEDVRLATAADDVIGVDRRLARAERQQPAVRLEHRALPRRNTMRQRGPANLLFLP